MPPRQVVDKKEEEEILSTARARYEVPPFKTNCGWGVKDREGEYVTWHTSQHYARQTFATHPDAYQLFRNLDPWLCLEDMEEQPILVETKENKPHVD